jgi:hypothetical protein
VSQRARRVDGRWAKLAPGTKVVVVEAYDEMLPGRFVGRAGVVVERLPYQEIGDDPEAGDPVYLVAHGPWMGYPRERQIYFTEEVRAR